MLLGETKTGEELQKVFAASYYCMYAVTIAHGSERAAETAELLCEKYSVPKVNFPEYSSVLFRRASSFLFCRKVLQTELWGLSKDKTTCQIPWVFRISVKSETHGFLHLEEISDMEVVNKTTYKRNENKYMLTKKLYCHILKIV